MEKRGPIEAGRVPFAGIPDKWKAWLGGWFGDGWGSRDQLLMCFAIYRRALHANCLNPPNEEAGFSRSGGL